MGILDYFKRNLIVARPRQGAAGDRGVWTDWTVSQAVREGFKVNSWVHRAVSLIAQNASQAPLVVRDAETGELDPDHPLSRALARPHPQFSRQKMLYLLTVWLQLAGNGYWKRVEGGDGRTGEFAPVSPDRLAPIPATDSKTGAIVNGYSVMNQSGTRTRSEEFTPDNTIHFRLLNPADPIVGMGPLQAAAKAVDLDNSQMGWNLAAMENRGITDGVLAIKEKLNPEDYQAVEERLNEKMRGQENARKPLVVGADAEFTRFGLTPAEADFIESRKLGREEIFIVFGVPPQLAGAMEAMTFNNFSTSLRILWRATVLPLLDDIADTLDTHLRDELEDGLEISYDTSGISALQDQEDEKANVALTYWRMGIPVNRINEKLGLGIEEFPGWDLPFTGRHALPGAGASGEGNSGSGDEDSEEGENNRARQAREHGWGLVPWEQRDVTAEQRRRDELAEGPVLELFEGLLEDQRGAVLDAVENGHTEIEPILQDQRDTWLSAMRDQARSIAEEFAGTVTLGSRGQRPRPDLETRDTVEDLIATRIGTLLDEEEAIERDLANIESTTARLVREQVEEAQAKEQTVKEIREGIEDVGVFSADRALRLSRTVAGTAASVGQIAGAETAGAETKTWVTARDSEVRSQHVNREGETVGMDQQFSLQIGLVAPRFPLDPNIAPGDRVNCRCSLSFS